MVAFDLDRAHPDFREPITTIIGGLVEKYPQVELREVRLFNPQPRNYSLGKAERRAVIELNPFWFARDPHHLIEAGEADPDVVIDGYRIGWKTSQSQPAQVLIHEFFHVFAQTRPDCLAWAKRAWEEATRDVSLAPSGYALITDSEYWAEAACAHEMGTADIPAVAQLLGA